MVLYLAIIVIEEVRTLSNIYITLSYSSPDVFSATDFALACHFEGAVERYTHDCTVLNSDVTKCQLAWGILKKTHHMCLLVCLLDHIVILMVLLRHR